MIHKLNSQKLFKNYSKKIDEELKKRFKNTFKFFNNVINKFILLFRKGVCPYEYMDAWENFNETSISEKEDIYSNFNTEDITDADNMHEKRVCKDFEIKNLVKYHNLYSKITVFKNFRKLCLQIYDLVSAKLLSSQPLASQAALKRLKYS